MQSQHLKYFKNMATGASHKEGTYPHGARLVNCEHHLVLARVRLCPPLPNLVLSEVACHVADDFLHVQALACTPKKTTHRRLHTELVIASNRTESKVCCKCSPRSWQSVSCPGACLHEHRCHCVNQHNGNDAKRLELLGTVGERIETCPRAP